VYSALLITNYSVYTVRACFVNATTLLRSSRRTVVGTAMNMATRSNGDVLAIGFHDVQDLILGTVDFLDIWVNLQVRYLAAAISTDTQFNSSDQAQSVLLLLLLQVRVVA
jgi:hypothetical protein